MNLQQGLGQNADIVIVQNKLKLPEIINTASTIAEIWKYEFYEGYKRFETQISLNSLGWVQIYAIICLVGWRDIIRHNPP